MGGGGGGGGGGGDLLRFAAEARRWKNVPTRKLKTLVAYLQVGVAVRVNSNRFPRSKVKSQSAIIVHGISQHFCIH